MENLANLIEELPTEFANNYLKLDKRDRPKMVRMLKYHGNVAGEVRQAYFLKVFGLTVEPMRIFSFGKCNFTCLYCKRDGQFRNSDGSIINTILVEEKLLFDKVREAIISGQTIRLSGGDPVTYPWLSQRLLAYAKKLGGRCSIAHNGSSPEFAEMLLPYLDYAAIDLKAASPNDFNLRAGIKNGNMMLANSLKTQEILSRAGVLVDVRTCVFGSTTLEEYLALAALISATGNLSNKFWTIRLYKPVVGCDWPVPTQEVVLNYLKVVKKRFPMLKIGLRSEWEPCGFLYL